MLLNIHVKNLALIEETEIDFEDHLNILTGETGAGKSILIGSIQSALGNKIPKDMIRSGCDSASIELVFHTDRQAVKDLFEELEIPFEEGDIIISRRITNQRVINKVNDVTVTVSKLKEIAPMLLDLSGQHENQMLLQPKNHMLIVDNYKKSKIHPIRAEVERLHGAYQKAFRTLQEENSSEEERRREIEFLKYEIKEIKEARLQSGEDEELEAQYRLIEHAKEIMEYCGNIHQLTSDSNGGASYQIGKALQDLNAIASLDDNAESLVEQLATIDNLMNDFNRELSIYQADLDFEEETFYEISNRLDFINHLKAKYGKTIEDVQAYLQKSEERYEKLMHYEEYLDGLKAEVNSLYKKMEKKAAQLSVIRKEAAIPLTQEIIHALKDLNFNDIRFEIEITEKEECQANGRDAIRFMISTNPGLPMGPLHEIASGGELSRIMLAIKSILADEEQIETLIFDEIDTGISGRTAQKVSERLSYMGAKRQVIAITHLPQIAAMADAHYLIEKTSDASSTISNIYRLSEEESVEELARMLGGAKITEAVMENAREMKKIAKQSI